MIFICYRREDSVGHTGRLFDRLVDQYGRDRVFMDLDAIEPGEDFVESIRRRVGACEVQLVVIGPAWARSADATGRRRLDDPDDFVRLEVQIALSRNVRVIPVLVGGATMPSAADLPEVLRPLVRRQAFELSDRGFHEAVGRLIASLDRPVERPSARETPAASAAAARTQGADYRYDLEITFDESFDGGEFEIEALGRRLRVAVPPGIATGQRLRIQGEGERGANGVAGDLYVVITVQESPVFTRDGVDLSCTVDVPASSLTAGGVARTPALGKRGAVKFAVPPGTPDGARLRLAGKGMPRLQPPGPSGDLYVTVRRA
jgi:curved DNA-binding protein CbpA